MQSPRLLQRGRPHTSSYRSGEMCFDGVDLLCYQFLDEWQKFGSCIVDYAELS